MYNLHLSPEQLEIRDTVRDFVKEQIKPAALDAERLNVCDRSVLHDLLDQASQMGLRTLALSEQHGGAGADHLTSCIVAEELAAGDADIAATLSETSRLGHLLFDKTMSEAQRNRFLPRFLKNDRDHLALACREGDTRLGINYHRPAGIGPAVDTVAARAENGDWVVNGIKTCVANAPLASLFAVLVRIAGQPGHGVVLVPVDTAGVSVNADAKSWQHGYYGDVAFKNCRVPADHLLADGAAALLTGADAPGNGIPLLPAIALGIGRAAFEAAVDYAHLRMQGGRPIIEHQAIAAKLADIAIKLEIARAAIWQSAWASDHPEVFADRSLPDLPLQTMVQVFTGDMMLKAAKDAAEIFGAMGVMRDMPLQKYVHDARVCLHSGDGASDARLRIAEAIAGYRRAATALAAAE